MPKFPSFIYVKWDEDGDIPYLVADTQLSGMSQAEAVKIAKYELAEEMEVRDVQEIRKKGHKNWFKTS